MHRTEIVLKIAFSTPHSPSPFLCFSSAGCIGGSTGRRDVFCVTKQKLPCTHFDWLWQITFLIASPSQGGDGNAIMLHGWVASLGWVQVVMVLLDLRPPITPTSYFCDFAQPPSSLSSAAPGADLWGCTKYIHHCSPEGNHMQFICSRRHRKWRQCVLRGRTRRSVARA